MDTECRLLNLREEAIIGQHVATNILLLNLLRFCQNRPS